VLVRTCKEEKFLSVARNWDIIRTGEDNKQKSLLYIKKELQGTEKGGERSPSCVFSSKVLGARTYTESDKGLTAASTHTG
jgi:hypothetical protein